MSLYVQNIFALADANNFYVSCEGNFNPRLRNRPVIVLSNGDGCVVARNQMSKDLGIKMGQPVFQIKDLIMKNGVVALSSNYALYADMSNRFMNVLSCYSPQVEVYSVDESFLYLNGNVGNWDSLTSMGATIKNHVAKWTGLPICIGFAPTKTLAKLSNHIAKKNPSYKGVCDLTGMDSHQVKEILSKIDVSEVWGVGRKLSAHLINMNIQTVQDLKQASPKALRERFGVVMERTIEELNGVSCLELSEIAPPRKQIVSSKSFGTKVSTRDELEQSVSDYIATASEKLRNQNSTCGAVQVFIMTDRFREDEPQYYNTYTIPLPEPTNDVRILTSVAVWGLKKIYLDGYKYKKSGVCLTDLQECGIKQGSLFDTGMERRNSAELMTAFDSLNKQFGRGTIKIGSSMGHNRYKMRFDRKTPCYTTDWNELPRLI